ncbi:MAG: BMP family ABC transporter substrate-binding protein [Polyangiaceae bacterium]|nr:BMP family ABC transporter substrate-binding protein [Polyangiaceae bacterium]
MKRAAVVLLLVASVPACANLVDERLGAGIGATCEADDQCQGSSCLDGICTMQCGDDNGCPGGTVCSKGICELPMRVGYIYPYPVGGDDVAKAVDLGRVDAEAELQYVSSDAVENKPDGPAATDAAQDFVNAGHNVIVATAPEQAPTFVAFAQQNSNVSVLVMSSYNAGGNVTSLEPRMYQAYYLAGYAAAKTSSLMPPRLGMIGSVAIPSVVARINAFALGAQRALKTSGMQATIEVRWLGDWHDRLPPVGVDTREVVLTRDLLTNGADVIAHTLDNNIPLDALPRIAMEDGLEGHAIAANLAAACVAGDAPEVAARCIGSAFYNWWPVLSRAFSDIQRENGGGHLMMGLVPSADASAVGFQLGQAAPTGIAGELDAIRAELAAVEGVGPVFAGPLTSNACPMMENPCVPMGETLTDDELRRMCWFVSGVGLVERDEVGTDLEAVVPPSCGDLLLQ